IVQPQWIRTSNGETFAIGFSLEKKLSQRCSVELTTGWNDISRRTGRPRSNFGDLEVFPKCAFIESPEHELALGFGADFFLPTGTPAAGAPTHVTAGPDFLWDKGMGDLPLSLKYLRPFAIQGESGFLFEWSGANRRAPFTNVALSYSLDYLNRYVRDFELRPSLRYMVPFIELNYLQTVRGEEGRTGPDVRLTPGLAYMNYYFEVALGTQIALTHTARNNDEAAAIALVDIFLGHVFPATKWTPF
ncbi:MAG: hypothetical protein ACREQE_02190, partial [Candidatus Binataceae bacterium]